MCCTRRALQSKEKKKKRKYGKKRAALSLTRREAKAGRYYVVQGEEGRELNFPVCVCFGSDAVFEREGRRTLDMEVKVKSTH